MSLWSVFMVHNTFLTEETSKCNICLAMNSTHSLGSWWWWCFPSWLFSVRVITVHHVSPPVTIFLKELFHLLLDIEPIRGYKTSSAPALLSAAAGWTLWTCLIIESLLKIAWHEPKEILSTSATDLLSPNHALLLPLHRSADDVHNGCHRCAPIFKGNTQKLMYSSVSSEKAVLITS